MSFLASELETENNCMRVWIAVQFHLSQADIITDRLMQHWKALFSLQCESRDSFLAFYSKAKSTLHKLKKSKSVTVTDNVFLKAYFVMAIEADELQQEIKGFLKYSSFSYHENIERIFAYYCAQTTDNHIRDKPKSILGTPTQRQRKAGDNRGKSEGTVDTAKAACILSPVDRNHYDIAWIANFKLDFERKLFQKSKANSDKNRYQNYHCGRDRRGGLHFKER